jgi:hypothetical protein
VTVSSDETYFSAVNYRGFPRQLTAAGFAIPRQLTAEGQYGILLVCLSLMISVKSNFQLLYYCTGNAYLINLMCLASEFSKGTHIKMISILVISKQ